ncbi:MAG: hypothetical protein Q8P67_28570, partial [archaeon]|nr:hypothetical protein [archaeon]
SSSTTTVSVSKTPTSTALLPVHHFDIQQAAAAVEAEGEDLMFIHQAIPLCSSSPRCPSIIAGLLAGLMTCILIIAIVLNIVALAI